MTEMDLSARYWADQIEGDVADSTVRLVESPGGPAPRPPHSSREVAATPGQYRAQIISNAQEEISEAASALESGLHWLELIEPGTLGQYEDATRQLEHLRAHVGKLGQ